MGLQARRPSRSAADYPRSDIDLGLVDHAFSGDSQAQDELWRQVLSLAIKLAHIICKGAQKSDIDEIVQEAMLAMTKAGKRLRAVRNWPAYIRTVITNLVIDIYRRNHRHPKFLSLDSPANRNAEESPACGESLPAPENVLEQVAVRELRGRLESLIATFPKEQAAVLRLRLQGRSYQEIADAIGCPLGSVGTWINRGKETIREFLGLTVD